MNKKKSVVENKVEAAEEKEIELVSIEDLRTAFGGEDLAAPRETTGIVNSPTVMCGGWV